MPAHAGRLLDKALRSWPRASTSALPARAIGDYSSAEAYELISQFKSISSCCGVVHSMRVSAPQNQFWRVANPNTGSLKKKPAVAYCFSSNLGAKVSLTQILKLI